MATKLDPLYLQSLSDNQLADLHHKSGASNPFLVLIEQEWKRRVRIDQHKFNEQLLEEQLRSSHNLSSNQASLAKSLHRQQSDLTREIHQKQTRTIITIACIAAVSTILAALLGAGFGFYLSTTNSSKLPQSEPKMETKISATKSPKIQEATALKNASTPNPTLNQTTSGGVESSKVTKKKLGK